LFANHPGLRGKQFPFISETNNFSAKLQRFDRRVRNSIENTTCLNCSHLSQKRQFFDEIFFENIFYNHNNDPRKLYNKLSNTKKSAIRNGVAFMLFANWWLENPASYVCPIVFKR
jgi:hypothetical protein